MIILNGWYGRLGNNIIQLSNIINIAIAYKHNIIFNVKHRYFDLSVITNYFNKYNNNEIITDEYKFFYISKLPCPNNIFMQNIEEKNKILQKSFLINNINKLPENDLVIHIRSGDIFSSNPHPRYIPPPLSYYISTINECKCEKIHIVCEDTKNPIVNKLLELYKNAVYQKNTLEKDISIILGSTNIIFSTGTFIPALMLLSKNVKYIYGFPVQKNFKELQDIYKMLLPLKKTNMVKSEKAPDYYKITDPWKNTKKQRDYILTYGL